MFCIDFFIRNSDIDHSKSHYISQFETILSNLVRMEIDSR